MTVLYYMTFFSVESKAFGQHIEHVLFEGYMHVSCACRRLQMAPASHSHATCIISKEIYIDGSPALIHLHFLLWLNILAETMYNVAIRGLQ